MTSGYCNSFLDRLTVDDSDNEVELEDDAWFTEQYLSLLDELSLGLACHSLSHRSHNCIKRGVNSLILMHHTLRPIHTSN